MKTLNQLTMAVRFLYCVHNSVIMVSYLFFERSHLDRSVCQAAAYSVQPPDLTFAPDMSKL